MMPGHRRLRDLPAHPAGPDDVVPARGHGHGERRRREAAGHRGRGRRLRHQALRAGRAAGPGALPRPGQALPRHGRPRRRPSSPSWNLRARGTGAGPGRRAGAARPAAPLPLAPGRRARRRHRATSPSCESHRREITPVFCDLRGFTRVRRDGRAGGDRWRSCASTTQALGELVFRVRGDAGALRRRRAARLLQRPGPLPGRAGARGADGGRHAGPGGRAGGGVAQARTRPRLRGGHRAGLRHPRPDRVRGALRLRGDRHASPTSPPGCARMARAGQILVTQRVRHGAAGPRRRRAVGRLALRGFSRPVRGATRSSVSTRRRSGT